MAKKAAAKLKATTKKRPGKGGARPGSGAKPKHEGGSVKITARLPMDVANWIESTGLKAADALTHAVRTCPDYTKSKPGD